MKVILDTNFLLIPGQFKVDIFREIDRICNFQYTLCIIDKTFDELNSIIESSSGSDSRAAKLALDLIKHKHLNIITTDQPNKIVDDLLVDEAKKEQIIVATNDKELKLRLKGIANKIIILKSKKYLSFGG